MTVWAMIWALVTAVFLAAAPPASATPTATGARIGGDGNRTRFVADISQSVSFTVYVLPDPYRVMIDIGDLNFDLAPGIGQKGRGLIAKYRYGSVEPGKSRIVIETTGPVLIEKSFLVPPQAGQPARLVVDLVTSTEDAFGAAYANAGAGEKQEEASSDPSIESATSRQAQSNKKIIVIDPGHGGVDPGAVSRRGTREKDVVFAFAQLLKKALAGTGKYELHLTRSDDRFVPLARRVAVAREAKADLLIAIHADTVRGPTARGLTLYTLSDKASDKEAEELAAKENRADIIGGIDLETENKEVTDILIDLVQRESKNHAVLFSKKALGQLKRDALLTGKPLRSAGFVVLKAPDVPSVLVELGYLSSKQDEALLTSSEWQAKIAKALTKAVDAYFAAEVAVRSE
jgi:N-acetylmuramoyl-L-alanine amidase